MQHIPSERVESLRVGLDVAHGAIRVALHFLHQARVAHHLHRLPHQLGVVQHLRDLRVLLHHLRTWCA
jgi:hypothetical protein